MSSRLGQNQALFTVCRDWWRLESPSAVPAHVGGGFHPLLAVKTFFVIRLEPCSSLRLLSAVPTDGRCSADDQHQAQCNKAHQAQVALVMLHNTQVDPKQKAGHGEDVTAEGSPIPPVPMSWPIETEGNRQRSQNQEYVPADRDSSPKCLGERLRGTPANDRADALNQPDNGRNQSRKGPHRADQPLHPGRNLIARRAEGKLARKSFNDPLKKRGFECWWRAQESA